MRSTTLLIRMTNNHVMKAKKIHISMIDQFFLLSAIMRARLN
jgi:hypothetical protein